MKEATDEHKDARQLIGQIRNTKDEGHLVDLMTQLEQAIQHHVKEEEGEMFEQLGRSKVDWDALLEEMLARRMELESELGLDAVGEDAETEEQAAARMASSGKAASSSQGKTAR